MTISCQHTKHTAAHAASHLAKKAAIYLFLPVILLFSCLFAGQYASAKTVISDNAHMLTAEETELIQSSCNSILERHNTSIYILTSDSIGKNDDYEEYMEQIGNDSKSPENLVLLFISTKEKERIYQIYGYGTAETQLNHERCNKVMDHMQRNLKKGNYYEALNIFCNEVDTYLGRNPKLDSFLFQSIPQLIFSLVISLLIILPMIRKTAGKNTTTVRTYIDEKHSRLLGRIDHFRYMNVHRVKKADTNNHGNKSSSSGQSHSSGTPHSF